MIFFRYVIFVIFINFIHSNYAYSFEPSKAELSNIEFQKEILIPIWTLDEQLKLLDNEKYDELEKKVASLMKNAEVDSAYEWAMLHSIQQISTLGKPSHRQNLLSNLNKWVEVKGSFSSLVFRGFWYSGLANYYRGEKWIHLVSEENLSKMRENQQLALGDFQEALKIKPNFSPIYERMIQIASKSGNKDLKLFALQTGLKHNPRSFWIRSLYLSLLTPRWGGSFNEMQLFINESIKVADSNPKIWSLRGGVFAEKAYIQEFDENYREAAKLYVKALESGDKGYWIRRLAYCYFRLDEFEKSKEEILKWRKYNEALLPVVTRLDKLVERIDSAKKNYMKYGSGLHISSSEF